MTEVSKSYPAAATLLDDIEIKAPFVPNNWGVEPKLFEVRANSLFSIVEEQDVSNPIANTKTIERLDRKNYTFQEYMEENDK